MRRHRKHSIQLVYTIDYSDEDVDSDSDNDSDSDIDGNTDAEV